MSTLPPNVSGLGYGEVGGYPIGMVATLSGLSIDVIRAWERRYGVPRPSRSIGGHRLYSPCDVTLLLRAAALRAQGLTAAAACARALAEAAPAPPAKGADASPVARLGARLYNAALALDSERTSATLAEAAALVAVETLWSGVIAPVLVRLGDDWAHGAATVAAEHLLSSLVHGRLGALMEALPRPPGAPATVIAAGPGERHDLATRVLALLLARAGWAVTFLGADTPADALENAVHGVRPRVVVVSATMPQNAAAALGAIQQIRERLGDRTPILAYGGPAFKNAAAIAAEDNAMRLTDDVPTAARQLAGLSD